MGVFGEYVKTSIKHWKDLIMSLTGAVVIIVGWSDFQKLIGIPWWVWVVIALFSVNVTQFMVWRSLRRSFVEHLLKTQLAQNNATLEKLQEVRTQLREHEQQISELKKK